MTCERSARSDAAGDGVVGPRMRPERIKELTLLAAHRRHARRLQLRSSTTTCPGRFFNRVTQGVAVTAVIAAGQSLVIITRNIDLSVGSIAGVSRLPHRRRARQPPRARPVRRRAARRGHRRRARPDQRRARRLRADPVDHRHARHAGDLPDVVDQLRRGRARSRPSSLPQWLVDLPRSTVFSIGDFEFRTMFVMADRRRRRPPVAARPLACRAASSTPSAPTRRRPSQSGCRCGGPRSPPSPRAARSPGSVGSSILARFGTLTVTAGQGLEFESIAAAVVGGVSTLGGSGTIVGSFFGAVLIGLLDQSLVRVPADQRVRPRRRARPADPPRRRARRLAVAPLRPPAHDHGRERPVATGRPGRTPTPTSPSRRSRRGEGGAS